jgi:hypothetical protein
MFYNYSGLIFANSQNKLNIERRLVTMTNPNKKLFLTQISIFNVHKINKKSYSSLLRRLITLHIVLYNKTFILSSTFLKIF